MSNEEQAPQGFVAEGFEDVRAEFSAIIFDERDDYAAQLSAYLDGEQVVDLWTGPEMTGESLTGVFSCTKGAAYLVVALLVQDGVLDLDQKVGHYWPEFAVEGKQDLLLREMMAHRAGVVGVDDGFSLAEITDDRAIAERLAGRRPYWRPGAAFGYHALVAGALVGEVVRRVTGRTLQQVYQERIRAPYDLDFHLGLPEELEPRFLTTLPMLTTAREQALLEASTPGPHSLLAIAYNRIRPGSPALETFPNLPEFRRNGPASVGGVAAARGLARMYAAATSSVDGRPPLLTPRTVAAFGQIQSVGHNLVSGSHGAYAVGFGPVSEVYRVLGAGAFGHGGADGSHAFADPRSGLAYGYSRRRYSFPGGAAPENERLVKALHAAATRVRADRG
ncbi:MAG TPA: serine hydrolase domain-containing protein [Actinocrinis sp.]|nr:serine hydrolase domain-containing protein [Actinocrinis sp.]